MTKRKQPLPKSGKPEKETRKARPLFPLSDEVANNIQSKFGGPYRHLSVHCFQALTVLERSGVTEQEIELLLPKLRQFASNVAEQSGDVDVYVNGLAWARHAVGMVWREHRDSGGSLNAFQVLAIAVIAYGDLFDSLQKSQPHSWQLHTDIALQMSILATELAQHTSTLATAKIVEEKITEASHKSSVEGTDKQHELRRKAMCWIQKQWFAHRTDYAHNKSDFARAYVRLLVQQPGFESVLVKEKTMRESWLATAKLASHPTGAT